MISVILQAIVSANSPSYSLKQWHTSRLRSSNFRIDPNSAYPRVTEDNKVLPDPNCTSDDPNDCANELFLSGTDGSDKDGVRK
jgi:hypothetical protein